MAPPGTASVPLEDLASLPEYYHPVVSPDGTQVAYFYDETGRNELYVLDRETGATTTLTDGEAPKSATWPPRWSATGDRVFFHRDEDGDEQNDIFAVDLAGTVERVVSVDG